MKPGMKALMMANRSNGKNGWPEQEYPARSEHGRDWNMEYEPEYTNETMRYRSAEARFRDRRGREHYDNGRFAPMDNVNAGFSMRREMTENPNMHYPYISREHEGKDPYSTIGYPGNEIGFNAHQHTDAEPGKMESGRANVIDFYVVRDHEKKPLDLSGRSDFIRALNGKEENKVWEIMDDLMESLKVVNPRAYNSIMAKLEELRK